MLLAANTHTQIYMYTHTVLQGQILTGECAGEVSHSSKGLPGKVIDFMTVIMSLRRNATHFPVCHCTGT